MTNMIGESGYERKKLDAYYTRPWVTHWLLGAELLIPEGPKSGVVWEPACGAGHISEVVKSYGYDVLSTDVADHGYKDMHGQIDFLSVEECNPEIRTIITNPPYEIKGEGNAPDITAEGFVRRAIALMKPVKGSVFMLLRHEFDCAKGRRDLFDQHPFEAKYILTKRPEWTDESMPVKEKASPRHNYSWFHWNWDGDADAFPVMIILPFNGPNPHGVSQKIEGAESGEESAVSAP